MCVLETLGSWHAATLDNLITWEMMKCNSPSNSRRSPDSKVICCSCWFTCALCLAYSPYIDPFSGSLPMTKLTLAPTEIDNVQPSARSKWQGIVSESLYTKPHTVHGSNFSGSDTPLLGLLDCQIRARETASSACSYNAVGSCAQNGRPPVGRTKSCRKKQGYTCTRNLL